MTSPRDSRGRFIKKAASVPPSTGAVPFNEGQSPELPTLDSFIMETGRLMEAWQKQYEAAARQHEASLAKVVQRYETTIRKSQLELDRLLSQQAQEGSGQPFNPAPTLGQPISVAPPPPPTKEQLPPSAVWIKAPDGEHLLLLNQQAAVMFLAVFSRMEEVTKELQSLVKAKRR